MASTFSFVALGCVLKAGALRSEVNPVTRVVRLLEEMKAQVELEVKEDEKIFENHDCWCKTNEKTKTEAVRVAGKRIEDLGAAIDEGNARAARVETEIAALKDEIAENEDAVEQATQIREKEHEEYEASSTDATEAIGALKQAVTVLSKVQLSQQSASPSASPSALVQVKSLVSRAKLLKPSESSKFKSVLQRDLWDMLGAMPHENDNRVITALVAAQQPTGGAAGAKSYNAQSSQILGILSEMKEEFERDLSAAQKAEFHATVSFQKLKAAKNGEIQAAGKNLEEKTAQLADTNEKVANAKEDLEDTKEAMSSDQQFLLSLESRCKNADDGYATRQKTRSDEIVAIAETISILTQDASRDLFSKSLSFLQTSHRTLATSSVQRSNAVAQLLQTAHKYGGTSGAWQLATLAVSAQLDGFDKVKEMIDKMVIELKKQQSEELEKHDACNKDIDTNEDEQQVKNNKKKDLVATIGDMEATIKQLVQDLEDLKTDISDMHISMKRASEDRKAQNQEFQQVVADQRATVRILKKALDKLREFYAPKLLLQRSSIQAHMKRQEPGAAVEPPPASGKEYSKSGGGTGVMSTIEMIIQDAEKADDEATSAEQESQTAYAEFVKNTNTMLDTAERTVTDKTAAHAKTEGNKLITEKDLGATLATLEDLHGINSALHSSCDYLIKNFNIRQEARQDEIESIQQAKAILSGADFGL